MKQTAVCLKQTYQICEVSRSEERQDLAMQRVRNESYGWKRDSSSGGKTGTRDSLGGKRKELCFNHN